MAVGMFAGARLAVVAETADDGSTIYRLQVAGGGGSGGGGGDASAANQTRTQATPGNDATYATAVQGVTGGKPLGAAALVVTGDQTYAVGEQRQLTMAPSGGLKVGVSYNANIAPGAPTTGGLNSALVGAKYYATRPTWADLNTGALQVDSIGNLFIANTNVDGGGVARRQLSGTNGGLLPGQATPTTTRTVLATGAGAQTIDPARANRLGWELQTETDPTAPVYIALGRTATATDYDYIIRTGAGVGAQITGLFGFTGLVSLLCANAITITSKSWLPQ